jgi:hypothetical protein
MQIMLARAGNYLKLTKLVVTFSTEKDNAF